jgi:serine/threonine protein phosphatase 1
VSEGRLLCIGDVHGCAPELERLLAAVDPTDEDRLVFLGDYVDRGVTSSATVDILCALAEHRPRTVFLRGNHEEMFLDFIGEGGANKQAFFGNGGEQTLVSYGWEGEGLPPTAAVAHALVPERRLAFFRRLVLAHEADGFAFVHAGVRPGAALALQDRDDLLWILQEFLLADHRLAEAVVFGHTPYRDAWFGVPRKIGLDTGCVYGGRLSCLDLTQGVLHQVARGQRTATRRSVAADLDRVR